MDKKVEKHPQCNHKEMKCSCMEKRDGTCLLRNPFDCPFEPTPLRLLTFVEWLCEEKDNIPFAELSSFIQVKVKAQYRYDKEHRLSKQDAKTASIKGAECQERVERILKDLKEAYPAIDTWGCWHIILKREGVNDG